MQIKRFEARDMASALRKVKKEFGEHAVILSAKTLKPAGGIFGSQRRKGVEITAASDRFSAEAPSSASGFKAVIPATLPDPANPLGTELPVKTIARAERSTVANEMSLPTDAPISAAPGPAIPEPAAKISATPIPKATRSVASARVPKPGPELAQFKRALLAQDISSELAERMVHRVMHGLAADTPPAGSDLRRAFERLLKDQLVLAGPQSRKKRGPQVVALVGPTGVGKTTTTAKIAAVLSANEGKRMGLISLDHQRIGGTAQLEVLARVMDLPLTVVRTADELKPALAAMQGLDCILIDTPGVNANHRQELKRLDQWLQPLNPDEVHLLLSATTKDRDLHLFAEQFKRVGYNRLTFTKMDETTAHGNLLNFMTANKTPLAYLCDSPKVPGGLILATAEAVVALFSPRVARSTEGGEHDAAAGRPPKLGAADLQAIQQDCFVANRNSDIFHQPDCKAVKRINPDNIVVFKNTGEAKAQNFKPCRMCCAMRLSKQPAFDAFRLKAVGS